MTFVWIWMFALLPLPWIFRKLMPPAASENSSEGALNVPFFSALQQQYGSVTNTEKSSWYRWILALLAWILLVTALARPALIGEEIPLPAKGRDIMLAIDLSGSMEQRDLGSNLNRLETVKATADTFIKRREGDRIGLILFSDRAYVQAPLTFDRAVVRSLLNEAQVGLTGQKTAIGDAIAIALKRLKNRPHDSDDNNKDSRVLVLLTDGANNAGVMQPLKAAEIAKTLGIKIYTIGVGGTGEVINTLFGRQLVPNSELDEQSLTTIANMTGGTYFRATDAQDLAGIYREIDSLEPVSAEPVFIRPHVALYYYPAGAAIALLAILMVLSQTTPLRRKRISDNRGGLSS